MQALDADDTDRTVAGDLPQHLEGDCRILLVAVKTDERSTARFGNVDEIAPVCSGIDGPGVQARPFANVIKVW